MNSDPTPSALSRVLAVVPAAVAVLALCFLCVVWGGFSVLGNRFPSRVLRDAWAGGKALKAYLARREVEFSPDMWLPDRYGISGVGRYDPERAFNGYTLYVGGMGEKARLINMDGVPVYEWHASFRDLWEPGAAVKHIQPDGLRMWRKAHVFPNGDVVAIVIGNGVTPWGYGLVKLDKDGRAIWKFLENVHHDFEFMPDGRIVTLTHRIRTEPYREHPNLTPPFLEDFLVFLSPDGSKERELSLIEAVSRSEYAPNLRLAKLSGFGEYLHANAVEPVTSAVAARHPFLKEGQVLVSLAEVNQLLVVDPDAGRATWAAIGPWGYQHDPDFLPNGNILLFDNYGALRWGGSRVIEVEPQTLAIVWSFEGTPDHPFGSEQRSSQQPLPNGNILISESDRGRILEVTRDREVVWEYVPPERGGKDGNLVPVLDWATRVREDSFDPEFLALIKAHERKKGKASP